MAGRRNKGEVRRNGRDRVRKVRKTVAELQRESAALEKQIQGFQASEEMTAYLRMMGRFHKYSFRNQVLIAFQKPDATRVAGYTTWKKMGRQVKKGEKGLAIWAPNIHKVKSEDGDGEHEYSVLRGFRVEYVFDISQTDGEPLVEVDLAGTPEPELFEHTRRYSESELNIPVGLDSNLNAYGTSYGGSIKIRQEGDFGALVHELAHELLHQAQGKIKDDEVIRKRTSRQQEELEAELTAWVVLDHFGVESTADKYLAFWQEGQDIKDGLKRVHGTTQKIIDGIEKQFRLATITDDTATQEVQDAA